MLTFSDMKTLNKFQFTIKSNFSPIRKQVVNSSGDFLISSDIVIFGGANTFDLDDIFPLGNRSFSEGTPFCSFLMLAYNAAEPELLGSFYTRIILVFKK